MTSARDPEDVLASIRKLVAREVSDAKDRETAERPQRDAMPVVSAKASAAARLVLGADEKLTASGTPSRKSAADTREEDAALARTTQAEPAQPAAQGQATDAAPGAAGDLITVSEERLRDLIREILREEVRTRMGPQINENIRQIVQEELARLLADDTE